MGLSLLTLAFTAYSSSEGQKAQRAGAREQKKAQEQQTATEQIKLAASRRQQIREERIRRAQILQKAETLGVGTGSGVSGATGALGTTTAANLGAQFGEGVAVSSINQNLQKAADFRTDAAGWQAASNLSLNIFSSIK